MVESAGYWIEVTETSHFWLGWWLIAAHTLNVECYRFSGPNRLKTWHWNLIAYSTLDRPIRHLTSECINRCHSQLNEWYGKVTTYDSQGTRLQWAKGGWGALFGFGGFCGVRPSPVCGRGVRKTKYPTTGSSSESQSVSVWMSTVKSGGEHQSKQLKGQPELTSVLLKVGE